MTRHYKQVVKRKYGQYLQWSAFFRIFFFLFKFSLLRKNNEKMMHIEKIYYYSSTICKRLHVDIFKITPTGRSRKRSIKKKKPTKKQPIDK